MHVILVAGLALAGSILALPAIAQQPARFDPPRAADGHPDLQGLWVADFITRLERPKDVATLVISAEEAAKLVKKFGQPPEGVYDPDNVYFISDKVMTIGGEMRSSLLVEPADGKLPFTALALMAGEKTFDLSKHGFDNPEERPGAERCVSGFGHPPLRSFGVAIPNQIVQTPGAVVIYTEDIDGGRIIDLDGAAPPPALKTRMGHSSGRWEGDTLIVVTTNLSATDPAGSNQRDEIVLGEGSRIIERFTLISAADMLYQFTVEDPSLYARPWLAELVLSRAKGGQVYEYACHEGNRGMVNILLAARVGRQKAKDAKAR